jgi:uracil-DNA glycosylase family 4
MRIVLHSPENDWGSTCTSPLVCSPSQELSRLEDLWRRIRTCRKCQDLGWLEQARPVFSAVFPARWMLIGQAPGTIEGDTGRPFSGRAGRQLFRWLAQAGWREEVFRTNVYMTAMARCYPGKNPKGSGDRPPSQAELSLCRPYLEEELSLVQPSLLILVGKLAIQAFLGPVRLEEVVGQHLRVGERAVLPLPHPSGASRWLNQPAHHQLLEKALRQLEGPGDAGDQ